MGALENVGGRFRKAPPRPAPLLRSAEEREFDGSAKLRPTVAAPYSGSEIRQVFVASPEFFNALSNATLEYCCTLPSARPTLPWLT